MYNSRQIQPRGAGLARYLEVWAPNSGAARPFSFALPPIICWMRAPAGPRPTRSSRSGLQTRSVTHQPPAARSLLLLPATQSRRKGQRDLLRPGTASLLLRGRPCFCVHCTKPLAVAQARHTWAQAAPGSLGWTLGTDTVHSQLPTCCATPRRLVDGGTPARLECPSISTKQL